MAYNLIEVWDIFIRMASIGQLLLINVLLIRLRPFSLQIALLILIGLCLSSYLMLTAPYSHQFFGQYRAALLLPTELMPYLIWALGLSLFDHSLPPKKWLLLLTGLFVTFGLLQFLVANPANIWDLIHHTSHWVELCALLHIIGVAYHGLKNDLVEPRRRARLLMVTFVSIQLILIVAVEIAQVDLGEKALFSALNAFTILVMVTVIGAFLISSPKSELLAESETPDTQVKRVKAEQIPAADRPLYSALMMHMNEGGYRQAELTITQLALKLETAEHRLRLLINRHLGFRNFSTFLNSYRIPEACQKLKDENYARTPILTIAMDLGYGSVSPFNRVFKASLGQTPSQYRAAHLGE